MTQVKSAARVPKHSSVRNEVVYKDKGKIKALAHSWHILSPVTFTKRPLKHRNPSSHQTFKYLRAETDKTLHSVKNIIIISALENI